MSIRELIAAWETTPVVRKTAESYAIHLPVEAAAKLHALAELYPGAGLDAIVTDLLVHALDEVATALPYVPGERVISEDEYGDPVYEDAGPTPEFERLRRAHEERLNVTTER